MFEIWWKDRLLDVVPSVGEVPPGLTVRSRVAEPVARIPADPPDWRFTKVLALCLLTFIACVAVMTLTPVVDGGADDGIFNRPMVVGLVLPPIPEKAIQKLPSITKEKLAKAMAGGPSKSKGGSGKAKIASLLSIWDEGLSGLGSGDNAAIDDALGKLPGGRAGADNGFGGMGGPRGNGPGMGPGMGIGDPGARRPGGGGGPNLGGKKQEGPIGGPIEMGDGLPRDLVAKVIRAHFNEIKYCYERELQHTQGLAGKAAVFFVIGPSGEVLEARISESTLDNPSVEECMLSRVRRWKFAEPRGGGTVEVNHPWIFRGAGDNDP